MIRSEPSRRQGRQRACGLMRTARDRVAEQRQQLPSRSGGGGFEHSDGRASAPAGSGPADRPRRTASRSPPGSAESVERRGPGHGGLVRLATSCASAMVRRVRHGRRTRRPRRSPGSPTSVRVALVHCAVAQAGVGLDGTGCRRSACRASPSGPAAECGSCGRGAGPRPCRWRCACGRRAGARPACPAAWK